MQNGPGYWGKFPTTETVIIRGDEIRCDSIAVTTGWNIIGSISGFVDTSTIVSIPGGIRGSVFFGYSGGYSAVRYLVPGQAYWVKALGPGSLVLGNSPAPGIDVQGNTMDILSSLNSVTLTDGKGNTQTLFFGPDPQQWIPVSAFAMPPLPPADAFDARFESAEGGSLVRTHAVEDTAALEMPIVLQTSLYPVTITWNMKTGHPYTLAYDEADGHLAQQALLGTGKAVVNNASVRKVVIRLGGVSEVPREFALWQNYPNPFNPSTSIRFALPVQATVSLEVFNTLGQRVRTLLNDVRGAGYHAVLWNGMGDAGHQLGSGVYFVRLSARGTNGIEFSDTRKMLLMK
jgi:hypothetical protein